MLFLIRMVESETEAVANCRVKTSMTNNQSTRTEKTKQALKEWTLRQALESKPQGLPKRNPFRDTSKIGNQPVRLSPKRYEWDNSKNDSLYWERRGQVPKA